MGRITRGTTPYHRFNLPIAPTLIDKIYITYVQGDIKVEKSKQDIEFITIEGEVPTYKALVHLTQQDTLKFSNNCSLIDTVEIQMDIKTTSGERIMNDPPLKVLVGRVLKDEVI